MIHSPDDPIAALATPAAASALAVIRVSGARSLGMLSRLAWRGAKPVDLAAKGGHTLHRLVIRDGEADVDDVLVAVYQAPRSYSGEESAEIFCHGSMPVIQHLLSLLNRTGFRPAGPGEFTQRAFLNGRMDLTRAEAVNEIVRSRTDRARALALERLGGAIESRVRAARDALVGLRASLEVMIDYPDDETVDTMDANALETAVRLLEGLTRSYRQGRVYQEGAAVVIAGATNSGKSSLFNLLLRQERAIVSEIHGTTRDWLEATVSIEGIPVRLFDTAGMRPSSDPLEIEGIRRTEQVIERADALVFMVDGVRGQSSGDIDFLSRHDGGVPVIKVWNKADLPDLRPTPEGFLPASASSGQGLEHIEQEIASAVLGGAAAETGEPLIDSARQRDLLDRSLAALARFREARAGDLTPDLLAVDLSEALDALGEITGEVTTAEILERMFADFCVGK